MTNKVWVNGGKKETVSLSSLNFGDMFYTIPPTQDNNNRTKYLYIKVNDLGEYAGKKGVNLYDGSLLNFKRHAEVYPLPPDKSVHIKRLSDEAKSLCESSETD